MEGFIDNYNFAELEIQRYWSPPSTWSIEKQKNDAVNKIYSNEFLGAQKRDGALYVLLKDEDGNISLRGRSKSVSGEYIDKYDHLPQIFDWANNLPNGCCFLGEVYWPGNEGSNKTASIMNCLTEKAILRQEKEENKLHYYIFDCLAYNNISYLKVKAEKRFNFVTTFMDEEPNKYIEYAEYKSGKELWNMLQDILANGFEGVVITHKDALYEPGKRPSKTTLKIKKTLSETIDCFFTGKTAAPNKLYTGKEIETWKYWVNDVTGEKLEGDYYYASSIEGKPYTAVTKSWFKGYAGSLEIAVLDGEKVISLGYISGLPDEIKENWKDYKHHVVEVGAMQWADEAHTRLRHGRIVSYRDDKDWTECTIDQIK